jgi:hypothetical protein
MPAGRIKWSWLQSLSDALAPWKLWVDGLGAFAALIAASFWFGASLVRTPRTLRHLIHLRLDGEFEGDIADLAKGVAKQSRLNALAAVFAGIAALLTSVSVLIGTRWLP